MNYTAESPLSVWQSSGVGKNLSSSKRIAMQLMLDTEKKLYLGSGPQVGHNQCDSLGFGSKPSFSTGSTGGLFVYQCQKHHS